MTSCRATLRLALVDEEAARRIEAALGADDDAHARTERDGSHLVVAFEARSLRSLLRAVDDVLANASVSEDLIRAPALDDDSA